MASDKLSEVARRKPVSIDSKRYSAPFFGILNAQGDFWTPLAFDSEENARQYIRDFWRGMPGMQDDCLLRFKVVPVRIRLSALRASASFQGGAK